MRTNSTSQPKPALDVGKTRIGTQVVKLRPYLDGNDQSVLILERLLEGLYAQIRLFQSVVDDGPIQGWHISTTRHHFEFLQYFACPVVVSSRTIHVPQKSLAETQRQSLLTRRALALAAPSLPGAFQNIYSPWPLEQANGWLLFYGGWDGSSTSDDRVYQVATSDFLTFGNRILVIDHGAFLHVNNEMSCSFLMAQCT